MTVLHCKLQKQQQQQNNNDNNNNNHWEKIFVGLFLLFFKLLHMWRNIGTEFSCRAACGALQALQDGG